MTPGIFRMFLALLVVLHHTTRLGLGSAAVSLFFCLSGYWMHKVWTEQYSKQKNGYKRFIAARFMRLLPVYWLCCIISLLAYSQIGRNTPQIIPHDASLESIIKILPHFFILGTNQIDAKILVPAWSLDIELQFYIVLPLLVMLTAKHPWISVLIATALYFAPIESTVKNTIIGNIQFFLLGMIASAKLWRPSLKTAQASVLVAMLVLVGFCIDGDTRSIIFGGSNRTAMYQQWNHYLNDFIALIGFPSAIYSAQQKSTQTDRELGESSYTLYLVHSPLVAVYSHIFGKLPPPRKIALPDRSIRLVGRHHLAHLQGRR